MQTNLKHVPSLTDTEARSLALVGADQLVGARPDWWWTGVVPELAAKNGDAGMRPDGTIGSLPMPNTATCTRHEVFEYFANGWLLNEILFAGLRGEDAFKRSPYHSLRHPMIFYYGHTACLSVNKLRVAGLINLPVNDYFERIFEVGVDEMSWDDMSKNVMVWPTVREVNAYRAKVFTGVAGLIATHDGLADGHAPIDVTHPLWAVFMLAEHERIHFETSSVLIREMPLEHLQRPPAWPLLPAMAGEVLLADGFAEVPAGTVEIGKPLDHPTYGWDNEYGTRQASYSAFAISTHLVTNAQFLEFVEAGGYQEPHHWSEVGWTWRSYRNTKFPTFWVQSGPAGLLEYRLRTIFEEIDMQGSWPVCVNFHEARAYLHWRSARDGKMYRLPTEAEHVMLRRAQPTVRVNAQLAFASEVAVDWSEPGAHGVHDLSGNVWDWVEDDFHPLKGFKINGLYDDFSTPCFDGEHKMILGGSFMSTGDEASPFARFHFRPHFFQHAGFHVVAPSDTEASAAILIHDLGTSKYENKGVLDQYLLFHYGASQMALPATVSPTLGGFPQRCADVLMLEAVKQGSGFGRCLDVGCAVGGASFALARAFEQVIGVDISAQFIDSARVLRQGAALPYRIKMEGDWYETGSASAPDVERDRIEFRRADACSLPAEYVGFDAVLAANLLCRLPSPKSFLARFGGPRGLIKPGGIAVLASPFSWMEQFTTKESWLGGGEHTNGRESHEGLGAALGPEFELVHRDEMPFMIREHRRKFEYVVSDLTVWRRKR